MSIDTTGPVSLEDADLDVSGGGGDAYFVKCDQTTMTQSDQQGSGKAFEILEFTLKSGTSTAT